MLHLFYCIYGNVKTVHIFFFSPIKYTHIGHNFCPIAFKCLLWDFGKVWPIHWLLLNRKKSTTTMEWKHGNQQELVWQLKSHVSVFWICMFQPEFVGFPSEGQWSELCCLLVNKSKCKNKASPIYSFERVAKYYRVEKKPSLMTVMSKGSAKTSWVCFCSPFYYHW